MACGWSLACGGLFEPGPQYVERVVEVETAPNEGLPADVKVEHLAYGTSETVYCKPCDEEGVHAAIAQVKASSVGPPDPKADHAPEDVFDDDADSAWCAKGGMGSGSR